MSLIKLFGALGRLLRGRGLSADLERNRQAADRLDAAIREILER